MSHPRRVTVTRRVEFPVQTSGTWGATGASLMKAFSIADREYRQLTNVHTDGTPLADDVLRVTPGDGEVVVFFEIVETA